MKIFELPEITIPFGNYTGGIYISHCDTDQDYDGLKSTTWYSIQKLSIFLLLAVHLYRQFKSRQDL